MVIWNLWVESQSHKKGCACVLLIQEEKESVDSELICGHVSKLLHKVALDLGLNLL